MKKCIQKKFGTKKIWYEKTVGQKKKFGKKISTKIVFKKKSWFET